MSRQMGMRAKLFNSGSTASNTAPPTFCEVICNTTRPGRRLSDARPSWAGGGRGQNYLRAYLHFCSPRRCRWHNTLDLRDVPTEPTTRDAAATTSVCAGLRFADVERPRVGGESCKHHAGSGRSGQASIFCTPFPSDSGIFLPAGARETNYRACCAGHSTSPPH